MPETRGIKPSYQQFAYDPDEKRGTLRLIAGPEQNTNPPSAHINQDARMYAAVLGNGETITYPIPRGRHAWVQGAAGEIDVNGVALREGDGLAVSDESSLTLRGAGTRGGEILLFDLA
jgi:redox-sensitive bicupin YhaK (pirin superfamily)